MDYPSSKYASTPVDGPNMGKSILPFWNRMLENYYNLMGWVVGTGKPLPETLRRLGLDRVARDLWGSR